MDNHTTFGFCPQGYLERDQLVMLEAKEDAAREAARKAAEEWIQAELEAEVTKELGGRRKPRSGVSETWKCRRCESQLRAHFRRNGHYPRKLLLADGQISARVPLVRCKCGGYVEVKWRVLAKFGRIWFDVLISMIRHYLAGLSYRKTSDALSSHGRVQISHLTAWRAMQKAGLAGRKAPAVQKCPRTVILDEMYVSVAGARKPILLAMDAQGRILGFAGPTTRSIDNWRKLLEDLSERGVSPDHGLKYVVADGDVAIREAVQLVWGEVELQDCIWHILARVRAEARRAFGDSSPLVGQTVQDAREVLIHDTRTEETRVKAAEKMAEFAKKHEGRSWVNTMARDFARATTYLHSPGLPRTNGTAERTIKEIRRRVKTMDGFKSLPGAMNFMAVFVQCYNGLRNSALTYARLARKRNLKLQPTYPKQA